MKYLGQVNNSSGQVDFYWPLVLGKWLRKKFDHPWLRAHTFTSNWQLSFLKKRKEKRNYVARPGIEPRTPDLRVRCPTDCTTRPGKICTPFATHLYIRNYLPYIMLGFQNGHLLIVWGQNFWQIWGLKKKREAVRWPKSWEVFNSHWENHVCVQGKKKLG